MRREFLIISPPLLMHSMVDLSWLAKCSFDPGFAEVGGTFSLILRQVSGSSAAAGISVTAGSGHNLQGLPGHKHPLQSAWTDATGIPSNSPTTSEVITRNAEIDLVFMVIIF